MKGRILTVCCFFGLSAAYGQLQKGTFQVGGALGYRNNQLTGRPLNVTDYRDKTWSVLPQAGWFVTDRVAVGVAAGYARTSVSQEQREGGRPPMTGPGGSVTEIVRQTRTTQGLFAFGPYVRFHWPLGDKVALFVEGSLAYGGGKQESSLDETRTTWVFQEGFPQTPAVQSYSQSTAPLALRTWGAGISPGLVFFPSPRWGIDASLAGLAYSALRTTDGSGQARTDADLNLFTNFASLTLGARYYLGR